MPDCLSASISSVIPSDKQEFSFDDRQTQFESIAAMILATRCHTMNTSIFRFLTFLPGSLRALPRRLSLDNPALTATAFPVEPNPNCSEAAAVSTAGQRTVVVSRVVSWGVSFRKTSTDCGHAPWTRGCRLCSSCRRQAACSANWRTHSAVLYFPSASPLFPFSLVPEETQVARQQTPFDWVPVPDQCRYP